MQAWNIVLVSCLWSGTEFLNFCLSGLGSTTGSTNTSAQRAPLTAPYSPDAKHHRRYAYLQHFAV